MKKKAICPQNLIVEQLNDWLIDYTAYKSLKVFSFHHFFHYPSGRPLKWWHRDFKDPGGLFNRTVLSLIFPRIIPSFIPLGHRPPVWDAFSVPGSEAGQKRHIPKWSERPIFSSHAGYTPPKVGPKFWESDLPLEIVMYFFVVKKVLRILPSWHISKLLIQLVLQWGSPYSYHLSLNNLTKEN